MSLIPKHLQDEFIGAMDAANDDDSPDGAWFAMLEDAGERFLRSNKLRGDGNDAAHEYLRLKEKP